MLEIAEELKISEDSVFIILDEHVNEKAVSKVSAELAHSQSKTTTRRWFRALFATVLTQQTGVFAKICDNG